MIFWKLLSLSLRGQMQYRASFFMLVASYFLTTLTDIAVLWILFDRFKLVRGWNLEEVSLIYGIVHMGFSLAESLGKGFDLFDTMIKKGDFDRILLRPISTLTQVATTEVQLLRLGRFAQGLLVLLWGAKQLKLSLLSLHALVIVFSVIGTASLFYGLLIIQAAIAFWTIETLEIMNITTYGGVLAGQYPISIYNKPFQAIFTFLIPLACVAYYPIATLLRQSAVPLFLGLIAPSAGFIFLFFSCKLWHAGVRRYCSTGS